MYKYDDLLNVDLVICHNLTRFTVLSGQSITGHLISRMAKLKNVFFRK